jgi:non-ribosomal peptide synthetase component F
VKESDPGISWAMIDRQTRAKYKMQPEQQTIRDRCFHPSGTFVEFPKEDVETSIPARFEKIVRMYPDRIAVKMSSRVLTYYELNQAANRIAHAILATRGRRSESVVISFEHSIDVIATTLGVLKAGKSYVALDPSSPDQRIAHLLDELSGGLAYHRPTKHRTVPNPN